MSLRICYYGKNIKASIRELNIGKAVTEPVKMVLRLEKSDMLWGYNYLRDVVCFYDIRTQNAMMDEKDASWVMKNYGIEESLCAYVKENMDAVFYGAEDSEKHLVEILCMREGVALGEHAMFYKSPQYGLSYERDHYVLEIPLFFGGMSNNEEKELKYRLSNSVLQTEVAKWLYYVSVRDASFLNKLYMVRHAQGKRQGTNVVRDCQKKVQKALEKAEEYFCIVQSFSEYL